MSTAIVTSTSNLSTATNCNNFINGVREASFASYLVEDQISAMKARHSCEDFSSPRYSTHDQLTYRVSMGSRRCNVLHQEYGELGVFQADKYFKGELDAEKKLKKSKSTKLIKMSSPNSSVLAICSDANCVKTQKSYSWKRCLLGLICSCAGKKSLDVVETTIEKSSSSNCRRMVDLRSLDFGEATVKRPSYIDQCLTTGASTPIRCKSEAASNTINLQGDNSNLPVYNAFTRGSTVVALLQNEEKPRISIEVFGSPPIGKIDMDPSKHRRLLMSCKEFGRNVNVDDDAASDSSSDLFEIQSLSRRSSFISQKPSDSESICRTKA